MNILPIDELNTFETGFNERVKANDGTLPDLEDMLDELLDLFLLAYASGVEAAKSDLGVEVSPSADDADKAIYQAVAGETWEQRVKKYKNDGGTPADIYRIAETDMTRIYNTGVLDTVRANGEESTTYKRWNTMFDDKVRDTHSPLDGVTVPYNAYFYSWDGDKARAPGMFSKPENNINCRCVVELIRG